MFLQRERCVQALLTSGEQQATFADSDLQKHSAGEVPEHSDKTGLASPESSMLCHRPFCSQATQHLDGYQAYLTAEDLLSQTP